MRRFLGDCEAMQPLPGTICPACGGVGRYACYGRLRAALAGGVTGSIGKQKCDVCDGTGKLTPAPAPGPRRLLPPGPSQPPGTPPKPG